MRPMSGRPRLRQARSCSRRFRVGYLCSCKLTSAAASFFQDGSRPMRTSRQTTMDREIARRLENSWRRGSSSNPLPIVAIASRTPGPVAEARSASRAGDELGGREMTPAAVCTEAMRKPAPHDCGSSSLPKDVRGNALASGATASAARKLAARKFAFNSLAELEVCKVLLIGALDYIRKRNLSLRTRPASLHR